MVRAAFPEPFYNYLLRLDVRAFRTFRIPVFVSAVRDVVQRGCIKRMLSAELPFVYFQNLLLQFGRFPVPSGFLSCRGKIVQCGSQSDYVIA
jgi:hypothetical protein